MQALAYLQFSSPVPVASMPGAQPGPFASGSDGGMAAGSHTVAESSVCIKGVQLLNGSVWSFPCWISHAGYHLESNILATVQGCLLTPTGCGFMSTSRASGLLWGCASTWTRHLACAAGWGTQACSALQRQTVPRATRRSLKTMLLVAPEGLPLPPSLSAVWWTTAALTEDSRPSEP